MRRRALLTSLSAGIAGLAGCSSAPQGSTATRTATPTETEPPYTETPSPGTTPSETEPSETETSESETTETDSDSWELGAASIVDLETANRTYALTPLRYRSDDGADIRLRFTSTATTDGPATVEAKLTNANSFSNTFRLDWTPPFGRLGSDIPHPLGERGSDGTYRVGLVFAPTANHDLVDDPPKVERAADGYWRLASGTFPELPETVRLDAGETIRGEYALVGRADGVGRGRPPGVYEFSRAGDRPVRVTVWKTDAPGPTRQSRFAGVSVPPLSEDNETAWFHEADASTPTFVRPSVERTTLPARVEFTFLNRSWDTTSCGHWNFYKLHDGEWFHLGPYLHTADCRILSPGDAKSVTIRAANGEMAPCERRDYEFLGGGRYAAVAGYGHATGQSAALVEFDAPDVTIVPTADVRSTTEGGVVTATGKPWRTAPKEEHRSRVELVLERTDSAAQTMIPEQVMRERYRGLRNTLAFVDANVERVVLRTDDRTANQVLGYEDGSETFLFDGQAYVVRKKSV